VAALWQCGHIFAAIQTTPRGACLTLVISEHILWAGAAVCFVIALAIIALTV
jgi:mannitol-specific phosphotransferase system IIBC component